MVDSIGVDSLKFTMPCPTGFDGRKRILRSGHRGGGEFATLERRGRNVALTICLPRYLELTNLQPLSESRYARDIVPQIQTFLHDNGLNENFSVVTAEVNPTIDISSFAKCSDVVDFFACALLSGYGKVFQCYAAKESKKYRIAVKEAESIRTIRHSDKTHILKLYNKGRELGMAEDRQILRYELVFQQRGLKRLFGGDMSIFAVISETGIPKLIEYFCSTTIEKILPQLKVYQENCADALATAFSCDDSNITGAFSEFALETAVDRSILKLALTKHYTGSKNASQYICSMKKYLQSKYDVPRGIDKTIKRIYALCKSTR